MTATQLYKQYLATLEPLFGPGEAEAITRIAWEDIAGLTSSQLITKKDDALAADIEQKLKRALRDLARHRPVQYVTGQARFCNRTWMVNDHVLIPRPETEELTEWAIRELSILDAPSVLDIGTGSGCIANTISLALPHASVTAIDISESALDVARQNAQTFAAPTRFLTLDFLQLEQQETLGLFDIVISNPPYIPVTEKSLMAPHVIEHEPHLALFVQDEEPLVFYEAIAAFGRKHLSHHGMIFLEIHENLGREVCALFHEKGYQAELRKDMLGKDRMVQAIPFR